MATTIAEDEEMEEDDVPVPVEEKPPAPVAVSKYSKFDPRVPCLIDGPTAVLRIKLVCTVLDTAGSSLISSSNPGNNNLVRLQRFLTCFQRYLFTKSVLPTEVEFATLDLFDSLDSCFRANKPQQKKSSKASGAGTDEKLCVPRYDNWFSAHQAAVAAEEAEALAEERGKQRLLAQGGDLGDESDSGDDSDDEDDENSLSSSRKETRSRGGQLSADNSDDESISESSGDSIGASESDEDDDDDTSSSSDESGSDDFDDDDDEDDEMDEADQQEAFMRQLEAEEFERELRKLTLDAIEKGKSAARAGANAGKVSDTMVHASQNVVKKTDGSHGAAAKEAEDNSNPSALGGFDGMTFKLLKRGHKGRLEAKDLVVPTDTNLAKQAIKQDDEEAREREMLKAKVLQYEAESNEQEISGGNLYIDQSKLTVIRNRPLSLEEIERNFGKDGGSDGKWGSNIASSTRTSGGSSGERRTMTNSRGRGGGRYSNHGGRGRGGRTLRTW
eukprot:CAMPEP_0116041550 /NCGR_PEP_ID=MMETSP0321-20121206/25127_1 /TAXON_ID=163516 /ORGANISM="Leptocylindrus danicus var. danicus, Strain B650" /LENGTH=499 /DNA_ID=CAMNT_0003521789 /DNA_START=171 /DNA_END=1670 /DNA_ORIENTATION=+